MARKRSIEIYLKEGIAEDDLIYDVWRALRGRGRPQDVFRSILRNGLRSMYESGELPQSAREILGTEFGAVANRRRPIIIKRVTGAGRPVTSVIDEPPSPGQVSPPIHQHRRPESDTPLKAQPPAKVAANTDAVSPEPPRKKSKLGRLM